MELEAVVVLQLGDSFETGGQRALEEPGWRGDGVTWRRRDSPGRDHVLVVEVA